MRSQNLHEPFTVVGRDSTAAGLDSAIISLSSSEGYLQIGRGGSSRRVTLSFEESWQELATADLGRMVGGLGEQASLSPSPS